MDACVCTCMDSHCVVVLTAICFSRFGVYSILREILADITFSRLALKGILREIQLQVVASKPNNALL